ELFKEYVKQKPGLEGFKLAVSTQMVMSWEGSRVPALIKENNILKNILPLLNAIELLDHKLFLEQRIEDLEQSIEIEKKRDILQE
ncbi:TPA: hypothetical protein ACT9HU_001874, partial [Legionella pneumophila]